MFNLFAKASERRYPWPEHQSVSIQNSAAINTVYDNIFAAPNYAGVTVNELTVMQVTAVYACVSLIGGSIASLPKTIYQRDGKGGRQSVDNDLWWILNEQPHENYNAAVLWESVLASLLLLGDGFILIQRGARGYDKYALIGLKWLHPSRVAVRLVDYQLIYTVTDEYGKQATYSAADIIHIPGPGFNGVRGMSQIRYVLRHAAGTAIAADQYSAAFFENGARPDFAIEISGKVSQEQQEMMRRSWYERYQGSGRAHLPALLVDGAKVHELTLNAEDSQLLETRKFQVEDIARVFGVPPHMIGHTENNSSWGSGVEQMSIAFVKYTLARYISKIEQELNRKIWPNRQKYFVEMNVAGLERGDYKTRMEGYRAAVGRAGEPGWMTVNEIRKFENMPPVTGGDELNIGSNDAQSPTQTPSAE